MSNIELLNKEEKRNSDSTPGFNSVGHILCYYRQLKGLSLEEIAEKTRIKIKYLYSLEQDITDSMPSPVYVYSYIKHYAKHLDLDGAELVKLYQKQFEISDNMTPLDINSSKIIPERFDSEIIYLQEKDVAELNTNNGNNGHDSLDCFDKLYVEMSADKLAHEASNLVNSHQETEKDMQNVYDNQVDKEKDPVVTQEIVDASAQAERIILNARRESERIIREARQDATQLKFEAQQYAGALLANLEQELTQALYQVRNGKEFIKSQKK